MGTKIPQLPPAVGPFTGLEVFELATSSDVINALSKRITGPDLFKFIGPLSNLAPIPPANFRIPMFRVSDGQVFSQSIDQLGIPVGNVPPGGATGQVLAKLSATSFDDSWVNLVFTGDVTGNGALPTALTIAADVVDNTKLANMAAATVKLRPLGAGTGDPVDGTAAQVLAILGFATVSTDNAVPRFNGTAGALENTAVIISDGNDLTVPRGLRVGFTGTPADDVLELGDANFKLDFNAGAGPFLNFDSQDYFQYSRSANQFFFGIANTNVIGIGANLLFPPTTDVVDIGTNTLRFQNLFLKGTGKIDFGNGDTVITGAANNITFSGGAYVFQGNVAITDAAAVQRFSFSTSDSGLEIGRVDNVAGTAFIDFHTGATTVDFDVRVIASGGTGVSGGGRLSMEGLSWNPATSGATDLGDTSHFWSNLFLKSGGAINWNNGNVTATHSANALNFAGGTSGYVFTTGTATSAVDAVRVTPSDFAVGKPYFSIKKETSATTYSLILWDGSSTAGQINFITTTIQAQGDLQCTAPGTNAKSVIVRDGTNFPVLTGAVVTAGNTLVTTETIDLIVIIGDGTNVITTGAVGNWVEVDFAFTIVQWSILAHESGSISIDVWRTTHSAFDAGATHPVAADKISATSPITFTTTTKGTDSTLTGWTKTISAQDVLAFNVASVTTCKQVVISLKVTKTS